MATTRLIVTLVVLLAVTAISAAIFSPNMDRTFFRRISQPQKKGEGHAGAVDQQIPSNPLFTNGKQQLIAEKQAEAEKKRRKNTVKYFAPQVLGTVGAAAKGIRAGAKLLGFLLNAIDTREPSMVRVILPHGGQSSGVEIEGGSVVAGQFNYSGSGDKVFINFHRLDATNGETRKIMAQALDSRDYTLGVRGEVHSDNTVKVASQIGLSLFAGMADVLTEKESMGFSQTAKPTMKNGLLQGMSRAAQDQVGQTSSEIQSMKDYVVLSEGKEMIIQLSEDFQK